MKASSSSSSSLDEKGEGEAVVVVHTRFPPVFSFSPAPPAPPPGCLVFLNYVYCALLNWRLEYLCFSSSSFSLSACKKYKKT